MYCIAAHVPAIRDPGLRMYISKSVICRVDLGSLPGATNARAGIQTAHPCGMYVVLVLAEFRISVHNYGASLCRYVNITITNLIDDKS